MKKGKVKKEFKFNSADYDYMDDMPLKGWMWEFIRRSTEYRDVIKVKDAEIFEKIAEDICEIEILSVITPKDKNKKHLIDYYSKYYSNIREGRDSCIIENDGSGNLKFMEKIFMGVPFPKYKYIDFPDNLKPLIKRMKNIITCKPFEKLKEEINGYIDMSKAMSKVVPKSNPDDFYKMLIKLKTGGKDESFVILKFLSPTRNPEDTVYIGISRTAKIKDIEKELLPKIRKYLKSKPTKTRDDKWKYYLIAYDLKKEYPNLTYDEIADKLVEAYPFITIKNKKVDSPEYFTARNCENLYKSALELIEGSYKKYLI